MTTSALPPFRCMVAFLADAALVVWLPSRLFPPRHTAEELN
jgi:hypothetical protein